MGRPQAGIPKAPNPGMQRSSETPALRIVANASPPVSNAHSMAWSHRSDCLLDDSSRHDWISPILSPTQTYCQESHLPTRLLQAAQALGNIGIADWRRQPARASQRTLEFLPGSTGPPLNENLRGPRSAFS